MHAVQGIQAPPYGQPVHSSTTSIPKSVLPAVHGCCWLLSSGGWVQNGRDYPVDPQQGFRMPANISEPASNPRGEPLDLQSRLHVHKRVCLRDMDQLELLSFAMVMFASLERSSSQLTLPACLHTFKLVPQWLPLPIAAQCMRCPARSQSQTRVRNSCASAEAVLPPADTVAVLARSTSDSSRGSIFHRPLCQPVM